MAVELDAIVGARVVCDEFDESPPLVDLVEQLLADPRASRLSRLGLAHVARTLEGDVTAAVTAIARDRPQALRELALGDHPNWHGFHHVGNIAVLWPAVVEVTRLALNGDFTLGHIAAPAATCVELCARGSTRRRSSCMPRRAGRA